ncbi:hypothetical protein KI387_032964, partial [Taxus chinensis]
MMRGEQAHLEAMKIVQQRGVAVNDDACDDEVLKGAPEDQEVEANPVDAHDDRFLCARTKFDSKVKM